MGRAPSPGVRYNSGYEAIAMRWKVTRMTVRALVGMATGLLALGAASCTWGRVGGAYCQARDVPYVHDEGGDAWQAPAETAARGAGDCEDKALYLHHLLRQQGIDSQVVFGVQNVLLLKNGHAWVECDVDGQTYVLDPTGRLRIARRELKSWEYHAVRDSPTVRAKLAAYLKRTGQRGINRHYEAAIAN